MRVLLIIFFGIGSSCGLLAQVEERVYKDSFDQLAKEYGKYDPTSELDSLEKYGRLAWDLANQSKDSLLIVRALIMKGNMFERLGNVDSALSCYERGLEMSVSKAFRERRKYLLNFLGSLHYDQSFYTKALRYFLASLKMREEDGNESEIAITLNNIGLVYYQIHDRDMAISYFERVLEIKRRHKQNFTPTLVNLGLCYTAVKKHNEAKAYYHQVIDLCDMESCQEDLAEAYLGLGLSFLDEEKYPEAEDSFELCIKISREKHYENRLILSYFNLSKIQLRKDNFKRALDLSKTSLDLANKYQALKWVGYNYEQMAIIYSKLNDFQQAYRFYTKYDSINSKLLDEGVVKDLADLHANYKEYDNNRLISEQNKTITTRTTYLVVFLILFVLVTLIVIILYRSNRFRKRANRRIHDTLVELRTAQDKLIYQEKQAAMNRVIASLAHQLNSPLGAVKALLEPLNDSFMTLIGSYSLSEEPGMSNTTKVLGDDIKTMEPLVVHQHQRLFQSHIRHVHDMTERMAYLVKTMQVQANPKSMLLSSERMDLGENMWETVNTFTIPNGIHLEIDLPGQPVYVQGDKVALLMAWQNIMTNAVEAMGDKGHLSISLRIESGMVQANFTDDGVGIAPEVEKELFEPFYTTKEKNYHTGLGLTICRTVLENHGGSLTYKSETGITVFIAKLPLCDD
ncbi:MAG: tetratricopeptide repeat protein [Cytophagales bacterium]|nr:tetratricopeptide repeat protein [Cytophagales bacterium]